MKHNNYQLFIVFSLSILAACGSAPETPGEVDRAVSIGRSNCISQGSIRDYSVLDDANLIVVGSARRVYHIVLARRAFGLGGSWQIGFRSTTGTICSGSSELIVNDGLGASAYRVRSVRELTPEDHELLLIRFGRKEPDIEQTPAIKEVEGAEVEELD